MNETKTINTLNTIAPPNSIVPKADEPIAYLAELLFIQLESANDFARARARNIVTQIFEESERKYEYCQIKDRLKEIFDEQEKSIKDRYHITPTTKG